MPMNKRFWRARVDQMTLSMEPGHVFAISELDVFGNAGPSPQEISMYLRQVPHVESLRTHLRRGCNQWRRI